MAAKRNVMRDANWLGRILRDRTEAFWVKVDGSGGIDDCWTWAGARYTHGYGYHSDGTARIPAHRWAYEHLIGPIPEGLVLDHLCHNRACVNPWHLDPVTTLVNNRRTESATKTHCVHGHRLAGNNLYRHPTHGRRGCRTCRIAQAAAARQRAVARTAAVVERKAA